MWGEAKLELGPGHALLLSQHDSGDSTQLALSSHLPRGVADGEGVAQECSRSLVPNLLLYRSPTENAPSVR